MPVLAIVRPRSTSIPIRSRSAVSIEAETAVSEPREDVYGLARGDGEQRAEREENNERRGDDEYARGGPRAEKRREALLEWVEQVAK